MYNFRGYSPILEKWVFGKGVDITSNKVLIHFREAPEAWVDVLPETLGMCRELPDLAKTKIYQGDILRYTFTQDGETYNRYYVAKEDSQELHCVELWRDYNLDPKTFEIERMHNTNYEGSSYHLTYFNEHKVCKVIGNIWDNPNLM